MRGVSSERLAPVLFASALLAASGSAEANGLDRQFLRAVTENDLYASTYRDRHYTNGIGFGWSSRPVEDPTHPEQLLDRWLGPDGGKTHFRRSAAFGQLIFTPEDIATSKPIPSDRPYAGWLYLRGQLESVHRYAGGATRQAKYGLALGLIGDISLARKTQDTWHALIDAQEPEGWGNQLGNEVAFNLTWQQAYRTTPIALGPAEMDVIPYGAVSLGTANTFAAIGGRMRFSFDLPDDFGPTKLYPDTVGSDWYTATGFSWYLFAGLETRTVFRDVFLDGNTFRDSMSVDKYAAVADFSGGIAGIWGPFRLSYQYLWRTDTFTEQNGADRFGSIALDIAF